MQILEVFLSIIPNIIPETKKKGEVVPHPKCLHIGIILIVYVIQKVVQKYYFFVIYANKSVKNFDISAFFCNFAT